MAKLSKEVLILLKKQRVSLLLVLTIALLAGCAAQPGLQNQLAEKDGRISALEDQVAKWQTLSEAQGPLLPALRTIALLKNQDLAALSALVHPTKGLRFTPYPYVDVKKDKVFTAQQVAGLAADTTVYQWGIYDGKGDPIELTYSNYYKRFIYDYDFLTAPMVGKNRAISTGNTIDNVKQAYPNGQFVEFYFPGFDPQYGGIDWSSLKLVFEQQDGTWYLVGIIHGQWTI